VDGEVYFHRSWECSFQLFLRHRCYNP
jgi:hypothetical protein